MKKIYLACPYSHKNKDIRKYRVKMANRKAAELMIAGNIVFSPLSHSHPISECFNTSPRGHAFWLKQDLWILDICDELHILCLPEWEKSIGIAIEIQAARDKNMSIVYDNLPKIPIQDPKRGLCNV